ncbi:hypothetical protein [uncultured Paraglaciecola sp.]|uniref:hypothetical protein n=1 Tax=uncultured Paraglaciecola sp. TaxID=1765024 RepID=UPI00263623D5|nr:hypothetical protein [uncultured Paraglaciecola sp.]
MSNIQPNMLQQEWCTLQNQYDSYEKCSLAIKLFNILICCYFAFAHNAGMWTAVIAAIVWLQDGIWKTFQSRIGQRLEVVEQQIQDSFDSDVAQATTVAMQFNLAWRDARPSALGLISDYVKQSLKPTVAYPHVVLIGLVLLQQFCL